MTWQVLSVSKTNTDNYLFLDFVINNFCSEIQNQQLSVKQPTFVLLSSETWASWYYIIVSNTDVNSCRCACLQAYYVSEDVAHKAGDDHQTQIIQRFDSVTQTEDDDTLSTLGQHDKNAIFSAADQEHY